MSREHIKNFLKNLSNKNYKNAKDELEKAVEDKLKDRAHEDLDKKPYIQKKQ